MSLQTLVCIMVGSGATGCDVTLETETDEAILMSLHF